jgi:Activator of Hsp90 ATPase homolog 1-like protein
VATLDGTITGIDPPRRLEISADWGSTAAGRPGTRTHLTWRLEPDGEHTLLHFQNKVEAREQDVPTAAGWHLHLDALAAVLAGGNLDIAHPEALFAPIHKAYIEKYGATPGATDRDKAPASDSGRARDAASDRAQRGRSQRGRS